MSTMSEQSSLKAETDECQRAFINAIKLMKRDTLKSTVAWEVILIIDRCAHLGKSKKPPYNDMAALGSGYRKILNENYPGGDKAIMSTALVDESLEQACQRAVAHFQDLTEKTFLANLTPQNRLRYEFYERPDKLAGVVATLSFGLYVPKKAARFLASNTFIQRGWHDQKLWNKMKNEK